MSNKFLQKAIELVTKATEEDRADNFEEALKLYEFSLEHFMTALKYERNDRIKETIRNKITEYLNRAEKIKTYLANGKKKKAVAQGGSGNNKEHGSGDEDDEEGDPETKALRKSLMDTIMIEKPDMDFKDVAGLESAKAALKEAVILPMQMPHLFVGKRVPWRGILLYGPPGTGKSYISKAIAGESQNSTFISVSSSDLVSKWQGQSERLVKALFEIARERKPTIIFIDEVDSLCSARSESDSDATRRIKTEFLVQMQGVGSNNDGILVLAATNLPWALDQAFLRRFERRIYIPLPDIVAREVLFKLGIGKTPNTIAKLDYKELAEKSEGFSGADINNLCKDAIMEPVRKIPVATHFKSVSRPSPDDPNVMIPGFFQPCSPGDPDPTKIECSWRDIQPEKIVAADVNKFDLLRAMASGKATVSEDSLGEFVEWTEEFGMT